MHHLVQNGMITMDLLLQVTKQTRAQQELVYLHSNHLMYNKSNQKKKRLQDKLNILKYQCDKLFEGIARVKLAVQAKQAGTSGFLSIVVRRVGGGE